MGGRYACSLTLDMTTVPAVEPLSAFRTCEFQPVSNPTVVRSEQAILRSKQAILRSKQAILRSKCAPSRRASSSCRRGRAYRCEGGGQSKEATVRRRA